VVQNLGRRSGSAIDGRTTQQMGYRVSQKKREAYRRMFWLAEVDCVAAEGTASRNVKSGPRGLGSAITNHTKTCSAFGHDETRRKIACSRHFFSSLLMLQSRIVSL